MVRYVLFIGLVVVCLIGCAEKVPSNRLDVDFGIGTGDFSITPKSIDLGSIQPGISKSFYISIKNESEFPEQFDAQFEYPGDTKSGYEAVPEVLVMRFKMEDASSWVDVGKEYKVLTTIQVPLDYLGSGKYEVWACVSKMSGYLNLRLCSRVFFEVVQP